MSDDIFNHYIQLMYFYRRLFKEVLGEITNLMGRNGLISMLRTGAQKYALIKLEQYDYAKQKFKTAIKFLLQLVKPEINIEENLISFNSCPFKLRFTNERPSLDEDIFCTLCLGFINGISLFFKRNPPRLVESRIRNSKQCKFIV